MGKNNFKPRHKFEHWVRDFGGTKVLALRLKVSQKGIQHWLRGYCKPSASSAYKILKLAEGKLSLNDILKARG